jgi:hypothetical protein
MSDRRDERPLPDREVLLAVGFVECSWPPCRVLIDPVSRPSGRCIRCTEAARRVSRKRGAR